MKQGGHDNRQEHTDTVMDPQEGKYIKSRMEFVRYLRRIKKGYIKRAGKQKNKNQKKSWLASCTLVW